MKCADLSKYKKTSRESSRERSRCPAKKKSSRKRRSHKSSKKSSRKRRSRKSSRDSSEERQRYYLEKIPLGEPTRKSLEDKVKELDDKINELLRQNEQEKQKVVELETHIKYMPNGSGFEEAKKSFEKSDSQSVNL